MERYVCIHGHFYQPSRMNPWLEKIELTRDAYPYHDWNERLTAECYMANCTSRLLDGGKKIKGLLNNYSRISFNIGPTLLSWLKTNDFTTYSSIIEADVESIKKFGGHGSAIAQIYNHMIMPLSTDINKKIQTVWAIKDFELNFKRKPEGIWLSETAVDNRTLEILAENGLEFTILSPAQALRIKRIQDNKNHWIDVTGGKINTRMPYLCRLPGRKEIVVFFYDFWLSNEIAFGDLLKDGENFAKSILYAPHVDQEIPEIIVIASDGETYGHHHRFGDMALAYCLNYIETSGPMNITVFGQYLEKHRPVYEVEIIEKSSWSCRHGTGRWEDDCGCAEGNASNKGWNQKWRRPLREATDWLEGKIYRIYSEEMKKYTGPADTDGTGALEDYIYIINSRKNESIRKYLYPYLAEKSKESTCSALRLLEMYRQSMLMQSSDGWFFDDISRQEPLQLMKHALRAMEFAENLADEDLEGQYKKYLKGARSNLEFLPDGAGIFERFVKPAVYDFYKIAACHAVDILLEQVEEKTFCFTTGKITEEKERVGDMDVIAGTVIITSSITLEAKRTGFILLCFNGNKISPGDKIIVFAYDAEKNMRVNSKKLLKALRKTVKKQGYVNKNRKHGKAELHDILKDFLPGSFHSHTYSIKDLPKDYQLKIADWIISEENSKTTPLILDICSSLKTDVMQPERYNLADYVQDGTFKNLAGFHQELLLLKEIKNLVPDNNEIRRLKDMIREMDLSSPFNTESFDIVSAKKLTELLYIYRKEPESIVLLQNILDILDIFKKMGIDPDLYIPQNIVFEIKEKLYDDTRSGQDGDSMAWIKSFEKLMDHMNIGYGNT